MDANYKCKVCGNDKFEAAEGFYYCTECGTQGENQQVEYIHDFNAQDFQNTIKIKTVKKELANQLTSWEEYNYILLGLVNELLDLGAKDELKMTTLQLWTAYLRVNEVAFYSRREPKIPKLGACFKTKDADILYNLKKMKRSRKRNQSGNSSDGKSSVSGYSRRSFKKQQSNLAKSEYELLQSQRDMNATMSIMSQSMVYSDGSSSASSTASTQQARLEFSRLSRRLLKKTMPKKHLHKHEVDGNMNCHAFKRKNNLRSYTPEVVSRGMMYQILYLALNHIGDAIQMGDLIRFVREGHLTYTDVKKFFPENIQNQKHQNNFTMSHSVFPSHTYFRFGAGQQRELLKVDLKTPDFDALTKRYINELCLPQEVHQIIKTLLRVCPPEMCVQTTATFKMPNYEGRAIALILFVMKLLFGLDDEREYKMSESALKINEKLEEVNSDRKRLFVWSKWVEYVEMRNVILEQCSYQAKSKVLEPDVQKDGHLYLELLRQHHQLSERELRDEPTKQATMVNFETIFKELSLMHGVKDSQTCIKFEKSLTPKRSNLAHLMNNVELAPDIFIPKYMHVDHSEFSISEILNPGDLRKHLNQFDVSLKIQRVPCTDRFQFNRAFMRYFPEMSNAFASGYKIYEYEHDISKEDWSAENSLRQYDQQQMMQKERMEQTVRIRDNLAKNQQIHAQDKIKKIAEQKSGADSGDISDDGQSQISSILASVKQMFEPTAIDNEPSTLFNCIDSDDDEPDNSSETGKDALDFVCNSFEYWLCMGYMNDMRKPAFKELMKQLPLSFGWMLKQGAECIQCSEQDVYRELQIVENQYAYVLQSFGKMKNTVLYNKITNRGQVPGLNRLSKGLRCYW